MHRYSVIASSDGPYFVTPRGAAQQTRTIIKAFDAASKSDAEAEAVANFKRVYPHARNVTAKALLRRAQ